MPRWLHLQFNWIILLAVALLGHADAHGNADWIQNGKIKNAAGELCCGERDCGEFFDGTIATTDAGYKIDGFFLIENVHLDKSTLVEVHETVPYSEAQPAPDGKFWRCQWGGVRKCFFAPPPAT